MVPRSPELVAPRNLEYLHNPDETVKISKIVNAVTGEFERESTRLHYVVLRDETSETGEHPVQLVFPTGGRIDDPDVMLAIEETIDDAKNVLGVDVAVFITECTTVGYQDTHNGIRFTTTGGRIEDEQIDALLATAIEKLRPKSS